MLRYSNTVAPAAIMLLYYGYTGMVVQGCLAGLRAQALFSCCAG